MSPHEATAPLPAVTDAHLAAYREQGYVLLRGLIPVDRIAAARDALRVLESGEPEPWSIDQVYHYDTAQAVDDRGRRIISSVQGPASVSPAFAAIASHPHLRATAEALLGGSVSRYTDQCGIKSRWNRTAQGGRTFYHQDSYYWHLPPEHGCNFWMPLDAVGPDAIALALLPGSQRGWVLEEHEQYFDDPRPCKRGAPFKRKRIPAARIDAAGEVVMTMRPGDAVAFTNFTWHRSEPNRSGETKCFYGVAYQRAAAAGRV